MILGADKNRERMLWNVIISISDDYFNIEKDWTKTIVQWQKMDFYENEDYIFLYTTSMAAYAIPKEKIMPEEKREEAIDFIKERFVEK